MLGSRINRVLAPFCTSISNKPKRQIIPPTPKLLSGQLQPFKFAFENAQLYQGYSFEQLYGAKHGPKHPPAVRAQMTKDTIAATLIFVVGFGLISHIHSMFKKQMECIDKLQSSKLSHKVELPPAIFKNTARFQQ